MDIMAETTTPPAGTNRGDLSPAANRVRQGVITGRIRTILILSTLGAVIALFLVYHYVA
jgi:hypothetical protein